MELYQEAYERHPGSRVLVIAFAKALVASQRSDEALELIDAFSRSTGTDYRLHWLAAEAYAQRGESTRSRFSLAEHYYLVGQLDAAIYQLQLAAQDRDAGYYLLSRVGGEARGTRGGMEAAFEARRVSTRRGPLPPEDALPADKTRRASLRRTGNSSRVCGKRKPLSRAWRGILDTVG